MWVFEMKLHSQLYEMIMNGTKDVELRLFDYKRSKLDVGDGIIFTNKDNDSEQLAVRINALYRYASFEDLFSEIPLTRCGFSESTTIQEAVSSMQEYYSEELEKNKGVIGISIELIDLASTQLKYEEQNNRERMIEQLFPDGLK